MWSPLQFLFTVKNECPRPYDILIVCLIWALVNYMFTFVFKILKTIAWAFQNVLQMIWWFMRCHPVYLNILFVLFFFQNTKDYLAYGLSKSYSASSNTLGIDLWRGRRCCSGNLQLPPLSQRQSERARTPDRESISRPTTLPLSTVPSIAITTYQDR